jgi:signal transduction histidine kinase
MSSLVILPNPTAARPPTAAPARQLPRSLSSLETWGFGMSGLLLWLGTGPGMHADLGPQALWVWLPSAIVGMLLNYQVKQLGMTYPDMSGGTANYLTRLLQPYPLLGKIAAIGYFIGWSSVPAINAIIMTDLIKADLNLLGITDFSSTLETALRIGFTSLPFILALGGTRSLSILHLCFVLPALGFLLVLCGQGLGWLAVAPNSPGFFPSDWLSFSFPGWAKWYFIAVYAVYDCETASSFVAESKKPLTALRCLPFAAWLIPPIYLGGSWLLMRLATSPDLKDNTFLNLMAIAQPIWGELAAGLVTLLIVCSCLLSSATAVSNCPRILYQLSLDGYLAPVFAAVSRRGVLVPAITFNFLLAMSYLLSGDIARILVVTGTGYLSFSILFHLGCWLQRAHPAVRFAWLSLGFGLVELVVLGVGGWAWGWENLMIGLGLMPAVIALDFGLRRIPLAIFQPQWWQRRYRRQRSTRQGTDFMTRQVLVLILLVCGGVAVGGNAGWWLGKLQTQQHDGGIPLFMTLLVSIAFVAVAIACWTSLPQVIALDESREQAEHLFKIALDAIVVLDHRGIIRSVNPAMETLFKIHQADLIGHPLNRWLPTLQGAPVAWANRSEQAFSGRAVGSSFGSSAHAQTASEPPSETAAASGATQILEVAVSDHSSYDFQEYVVLLRDITDRVRAETALRSSESQLRQQTEDLAQTLEDLQQTQLQMVKSEKMATLGNLMAGVAHEINNPVGFISGNLKHAEVYIQDLLQHLQMYQDKFPEPGPEILESHEAIDLDYLRQDLPSLVSSMHVGTERIASISTSLRNFSRSDTTQKVSCNIHDGINSTLLILKYRLKASELRPEIQVSKDFNALPKVSCFPGQLNQVLMNIIANCIDAFEEACVGQTFAELQKNPQCITIRTDHLVDQQAISIAIQDNGPGMPEAVRRQIFDHLFTTKGVGAGTGLGLSISRDIVESTHGGKLTCDSTPGQGTEFVIWLPIG